uniref:Ovule protein n=1 Tax=Steinernema glaseri TaxID=37863 RepID=A0A1I7Z9Z7_9BILA
MFHHINEINKADSLTEFVYIQINEYRAQSIQEQTCRPWLSQNKPKNGGCCFNLTLLDEIPNTTQASFGKSRWSLKMSGKNLLYSDCPATVALLSPQSHALLFPYISHHDSHHVPWEL